MAVRRSRLAGMAAVLAVVVAIGAVAALASREDGAGAGRGRVSPAVQAVMDVDRYRHSRWGMVVTDAATGEVLTDLNADEMFVPGSTTKAFSVTTTWDALGPDHRFVTPVHRTGAISGGTLNGDLVLVASGDLVLGGRAQDSDEIAFSEFDHMEANSFPAHAKLTPQDPLAGLDSLARQVKASGVHRVAGDVVIDARLYRSDAPLSGIPLTPIMVNENVIDVSVVPGAADGTAAAVAIRPVTSATRLQAAVTTGAPGSAPAVTSTMDSDGTIRVNGTVPAGGDGVVNTVQISDAESFARTAFVDALRRADVEVTAQAAGPNPSAKLPPKERYDSGSQVAQLRSAPFSEYAKLIMKVSHNLGADTNMCLLAVHKGSPNCADGVAAVGEFLRAHGVAGDGFSFADGRGGAPGDLTTPNTAAALLRYWLTRPDYEALRAIMPVLGVDGTIGGDEKDSPARGKVFAKTGTVAGGDLANQRVIIQAQALAGIADGADGRKLAFAVYVANVGTPEVDDVLKVSADLARIAALVQQRI